MSHAGPADALARVRSALARSTRAPTANCSKRTATGANRTPLPHWSTATGRAFWRFASASPDTTATRMTPAKPSSSCWPRAADVRTVSDPAYATVYPQVSPNGKTLLFMGMKLPEGIPEKPIDENKRLYLQPIGGKVSELPDVPLNAEIQGFSWFPDGKKIAYTWRRCTPKRRRPARSTTAKPNRTCAFATPTARTTKPS